MSADGRQPTVRRVVRLEGRGCIATPAGGELVALRICLSLVDGVLVDISQPSHGRGVK